MSDQPQPDSPMDEVKAGNVGFVCEKHRRVPDPRFLEHPPEWFIGKFCQLAFPFNEGQHEYMQVLVHKLAETDGEELHGELNNDPIYTTDVSCGDLIEFSRSEILQVMEQ